MVLLKKLMHSQAKNGCIDLRIKDTPNKCYFYKKIIFLLNVHWCFIQIHTH